MNEINRTKEYMELLNVAKENIGNTAYVTIFLFLFTSASVIGLQILFINNILPYWAHLIISSYLFYCMYTPLHEAIHGNISGKNKKLTLLNNVIGSLSAYFYLHSYTQHKWSHLRHHKYANDPRLDPDYIIKGSNWGSIILRSFFLLLIKDFFYAPRDEIKNEPGTRRAMNIGSFESLMPIVLIIILTNYLNLPWYHFIISYVIPLLFAVTLLGVFFDYLVHMPHKSNEKFGDTNVIRIKSWLDYPMTMIWLFQNYHGIHHLFPRIPFYRYKKVFVASEKNLEKLGLPIFTIGKNK